jgi:hypothetical protein
MPLFVSFSISAMRQTAGRKKQTGSHKAASVGAGL